MILTVGELRRSLEAIPDHVWVVVDGTGPIAELSAELGANEPFVVLKSELRREPPR